MLYVKKIMGSFVRVADTTDHRESNMSRKKLKTMIMYSNANVAGVRLAKDGKMYLKAVPAAENSYQSRLLMLFGYVYFVKDDMLDSIVFDSDYKVNTSVCLGNFCSTISDYAVYIDDDSKAGINFVFDDRITYVDEFAFVNVHSVFVSFDLRQVTKRDLLFDCYRAAERSNRTILIIDEPARFDVYIREAELLFEKTVTAPLTVEADKHVLKYHKDEFLTYIPSKARVVDKHKYKDSLISELKKAANSGTLFSSSTHFYYAAEIMVSCGASSKIDLVKRYLCLKGSDKEITNKYLTFFTQCLHSLSEVT